MSELNPYSPSFPIVGIGASAGGLKAIEALLSHLPTKPDVAFVIVQHLSPHFKSLMQEILSKDVSIPVKIAEDEMEVLPNHIFLIPAGQNMTIEAGRLRLVQQENQRPYFVIDLFLHSLAADAGPLAAAVILSGTGSDGSRGIQSIRDAGGITIVQEPNSGEFDGMPKSAIETGAIDYVLSPTEIGDFISNQLIHKLSNRATNVEATPPQSLNLQVVDEEHFKKILDLLAQAYGVDFNLYKRKTILRRIEKNMDLQRLKNMSTYLAHLKERPENLEALFYDILIGVTEFFRNPNAFKVLNQKVFPALENKMKSDAPIRIWVCGCSSGEEVYSLGIAISEYAERQEIAPNFTILATDVNSRAVATASRGHYQVNKLESLDQKIVSKYFDLNGKNYEVKQSLRDHIIFATNNAISDPPFINLDLISCRNLLIYLKQAAQRRLLLNFHFGLNSGGFLLLGSSENVLDYQENFQVISEKEKLFQAYGESPKYRDVQSLKPLSHRHSLKPMAPPSRASVNLTSRTSGIPFMNSVLKRYAPPFAIFDHHFTLLFSGGGASQFLQVPEMSPSNDLLGMVTDATVVALRDSLQRFESESGPFLYQGTGYGIDLESEPYQLMIERLASLNEDPQYILEWKKVGEEADSPLRPSQIIKPPVEETYSHKIVRTLQEELRIAQYQTQSIREELESTNEELQASNEELLASNEELQSTNEELQSVNEELYTVNSELQARNVELSTANLTIDNLLASSDIGVLHLDLDFKIRLFTPPIKRLVSLEQSDIGVPIEKFHLRWTYPDFLRDIDQVVRTGNSIDREVSSEETGVVYLVQIHPYKNMDLIEGILVNMVDVSDLKRIERSLKAAEQNQRRTLDNIPSVIFKIDVRGEINYLNKAIGGYNRAKMLGANIKDFLAEVDISLFEQKLQEAILGREKLEFLTTSVSLDGSELSLHNSLVPLVQSDGQIQELLLVCRTYAGEKVISKEEFERLTRLSAVLSDRHIFLSVKDQDFSYQFVNLPFANFLQKPIPSIFQNNDFGIFPSNVAEALRHRDQQVLKSKEPLTTIDEYQLGENRLQLLSHRFILKEEENLKIAHVGIRLGDEILLSSEGQIESQKELENIVADRTEALVQANQELRTITRSMAHDLRTPLRAIQSYGELLHETLEVKLDAQENDYFYKIRRQSNRMTQIIDGLISYVKLGGIKVTKEQLDPQAIAQSAWEDFKHLLNGTAGKVIYHQCPAIWGDRILTQQIISNLISNSIKYRKPDEELEIEFGAIADETSDRWVYYVKDNGQGFDPKFSSRIFQVFERLHAARNQEGYGIGLSIVKKSVELMGGKIWVTSQIGEGATFFFSIPKA